MRIQCVMINDVSHGRQYRRSIHVRSPVSDVSGFCNVLVGTRITCRHPQLLLNEKMTEQIARKRDDYSMTFKLKWAEGQ